MFRRGSGEDWPQWFIDWVEAQIKPGETLAIPFESEPDTFGIDIGNALARQIDDSCVSLLQSPGPTGSVRARE